MAIVGLLKAHILLIYISVHLIGDCNAQCGICLDSSSVACFSKREYRYCVNGVPTNELVSCPSNTVCADDSAICVADGTPACKSKCGKCGVDNKFACIDERSFAYCYGTQTPSSTISTCPSNLVCSNSQPPNFCVDPLKYEADCEASPTHPPPTTTTPAGLCSGPGRFPFPGTKDCKQYIYCFYSNKVLRAQIYYCQGSTIFYPPMQLCVPSSDVECIT